MEHGGNLQVINRMNGYRATMRWEDKIAVGDFATNIPDAITSLNEMLWDDVADECCPPKTD